MMQAAQYDNTSRPARFRKNTAREIFSMHRKPVIQSVMATISTRFADRPELVVANAFASRNPELKLVNNSYLHPE